jgi:hypothetical protein
MKKIMVLLAASLSLSVSLSVLANHHEEGQATGGEKCEGMSHGNFSISGLDANKDDVITLNEYLAGDQSNTEKVFKHIDANSDGKLDKAEQTDIEAVYKMIHQDSKAKHISI